jgi:hypothetical protein
MEPLLDVMQQVTQPMAKQAFDMKRKKSVY